MKHKRRRLVLAEHVSIAGVPASEVNLANGLLRCGWCGCVTDADDRDAGLAMFGTWDGSCTDCQVPNA